MEEITRRRLDIVLLGAIVVVGWAIIITVAFIIVSLTARPAHAQTQMVCCGPSGQLWPCTAGDAQCRGPMGLSCTGTGVSIVPASACAAATPTPAPTATPVVTPVPASAGPAVIGFDPYQVTPCFVGPTGQPLEHGGGLWLCPPSATKRWIVSSTAQATAPSTDSLWVPWGLVNRVTFSQPLGTGNLWNAAISTNDIDNPCPLTCNGWMAQQVNDGTLADVDAPTYTVADDLTMYLTASWAPIPLANPGMSRFIATVTFNLPDGGWAELDLNLGMTPSWPFFTVGAPGYVWVSQPGIYSSIGLRYYVVMDGPGMGFTDAGPTKTAQAMYWSGVHTWVIPVSALVRKARADWPTMFPVPDTARISGFALQWEQNGPARQDLWLQEMHLWAHGPQTMPAAPPLPAKLAMTHVHLTMTPGTAVVRLRTP
jgi:hypothetical protein